MKNITTLAVGIMIGMSIVATLKLGNKPKPQRFRPISVEQFEREQPPVLQKYGKLIVD
jgi:hypothetical protein